MIKSNNKSNPNNYCGLINGGTLKILVADKTEPEVLEKLKTLGDVVYQPSDLKSQLVDSQILIVRSATKVTRELLSSTSSLKLIIRAGVGLDNVDPVACKEKSISVMNTPGASTNAVAELAVGLIFSLLRKIPQAHASMKAGKWEKKSLTGLELSGKAVGIVGYGRIGSAVGRMCKALGMRVLYTNLADLNDGVGKHVELELLLAEADVISIHTVLTDQTRGMFNAQAFSKMKKGAYLINLARGQIVDEDALYDALISGQLAGAALDVFSQEPYTGKLLGLENIVLTPHIGASTKEAQLRIGAEIIQIIKDLKS
ncbi:hydroxyacid dehydrogenase [Candidatus Parvarchaeota archaeon]|nr:hydroxyacid dehydrogenase [Candidatus Parvarchaeota archaeon]